MTRILIHPDGTATPAVVCEYIHRRAVSLHTPKEWTVQAYMMRDVTPPFEGGSGVACNG